MVKKKIILFPNSKKISSLSKSSSLGIWFHTIQCNIKRLTADAIVDSWWWDAVWAEIQVGAVESAERAGGGAYNGPGVRGQQCTANIHREMHVNYGIYITSKGADASNIYNVHSVQVHQDSKNSIVDLRKTTATKRHENTWYFKTEGCFLFVSFFIANSILKHSSLNIGTFLCATCLRPESQKSIIILYCNENLFCLIIMSY